MDAPPHPLVARLAQQLFKNRFNRLDVSAKSQLAQKLVAVPNPDANLTAALQPVAAALEAGNAVQPQQRDALDAAITALLQKQPFQLTIDEQKGLANAVSADIPELVTVAGYLGSTVDVQLRGRYAKWWVLYLDSQLQSWRLLPDEEILFHISMDDDRAPFKKRDVIWVDADAQTARGEAPPRPDAQAKFLRGEFTRAGDLTAPAPGGSQSPSTGVFCDATTPSCCTKTVRP